MTEVDIELLSEQREEKARGDPLNCVALCCVAGKQSSQKSLGTTVITQVFYQYTFISWHAQKQNNQ